MSSSRTGGTRPASSVNPDRSISSRPTGTTTESSEVRRPERRRMRQRRMADACPDRSLHAASRYHGAKRSIRSIAARDSSFVGGSEPAKSASARNCCPALICGWVAA